MEAYCPPFHITQAMLQLTASISEKVGAMHVLLRTESRPHLRRSSQIQSIHASLKIESGSLTAGQVRDVIAGIPVRGAPDAILEVQNAYTAYEKMTELDPYSLEDLKTAHGLMTAGLIRESGRFRSGEEGVFHEGKCIFVAPPARLVPDLMEQLFSWMNRERENLHPLILSSVFHYEFVFIHPFSDGNGRMARLWHTALLTRWKPVFQYVPLESQIEKFQQDYYDAISCCHTAGNSDRFIEFMLEQTDQILETILQQSGRMEPEISDQVRRLLSVMEYGVSYSTSGLMEKLQLKSRDTFRKHYLQPALSLQLVEMTLPDRPTSRNQRYIRK